MMDLLRRHSKTIFFFVGIIVIISFVWWGVPGQVGGASGGFSPIRLGNRTISSEQVKLATDAIRLPYLLTGQRFPLDGEQLEHQILRRVLLVERARTLNLRVSDDQAEGIKARLLQIQAKPGEDPVGFNQRQREHVASVTAQLAAQGIRPSDFDRIIRENMLIGEPSFRMLGHVHRAVMATSNPTPQEVQLWWNLSHETMTVSLVRFSTEDYRNKVEVSEADALDWYTKLITPPTGNPNAVQQPNPFALPEKRKVRYVRFDLEAAKKEIVLSDQDLRAAYERHKDQVVDDKGQPKPFEAVRAEIEESLKEFKARESLRNRTRTMIEEVSPVNPSVKAISFDEAAKNRNLAITTTDFFAMEDTVPGVKVPVDFRTGLSPFNNEAFRLRNDLRVNNPVEGEDGVYVMEYVEIQPPNDKPDFSVVKNKVIATRKETIGREETEKAGKAARTLIGEALAKGQTFAQACEAAGLKPVTLPPFSSREPIKNSPDSQAIQYIVFPLNTGDTSEFVATPEGGFILHLDARNGGDPKDFEKEAPELQRRLITHKRNLAFQEWLNRSFQQAGIQ